MSTREPVVLSLAGTDPSGGAGLLADLKTFTELGVMGAGVVTGLTVQDTTGVHDVHPVPPEVVVAQYATVVEDLDVRAAKTGMLGSAALVLALATALADRPLPALVVDPVMVATSGDRLVPDDALEAVRDALLPLADVVTPNLPEAAALTGRPCTTVDDMVEVGRALLRLGAGAALVKGGHGAGELLTDVLVTADEVVVLPLERIETPHTHGTGCALAAALAAGLAVGLGVSDAARSAQAFVHAAVRSGAGLQVGRGAGPIDHLRGRRWAR